MFRTEAVGGVAVTSVRVVVADDDVLLREGLVSLLQRSGFDVVGQAGDASQLLALVREHRPELAVVDIRMPPGHSTEGLEAAREIRGELPDTGILVLSAHVEVEHAMELLAGGRGIGYLLKDRIADVADFLDALQRIAKGGSVVDPALVQELVAARRREDPLAVLRDEAHGSAGFHEVAVLLLGVSRDQDDGRRVRSGHGSQPVGQVQAALAAEIQIDQYDVGPQLGEASYRLRTTRRHACDRHALPLQQPAGDRQEPGTVVDDQATHHISSITVGSHPAHSG
jgi:DNA-binding NarL/FixJ family response regulator